LVMSCVCSVGGFRRGFKETRGGTLRALASREIVEGGEEEARGEGEVGWGGRN